MSSHGTMGRALFVRWRRELAPTVAFAALLALVALFAPAFYSLSNLRDIALNNAPVLLVAVGMTLVILVGEIDISIGSQFAVCGVLTAWFAKHDVPIWLLPVLAMTTGAALGALNGVLIGRFALPSIIVTLGTMVALRDGLRWTTAGAWVQDLPGNFQWFGLDQRTASVLIVAISLGVMGLGAFMLRRLAIGRALFATGSSPDAAWLTGIDTARVRFGVFVVMGALAGLASLLNAVRFDAVPSNAGIGLEIKAIAAVVVGGASITGGRASLFGTLIGVALLGTIGTALTFVGVSPFWERAIQGAIILAALGSDVFLSGLMKRAIGGLGEQHGAAPVA